MEYKLEELDNKRNGYKIPWDELEKILNTVVPKETYGNGWFQDWYCNNWEKEIEGVKYSRSYLVQKEFRKDKIKYEKHLGYYDNIVNAYVITDRRYKITDVIELFKEKEGIL